MGGKNEHTPRFQFYADNFTHPPLSISQYGDMQRNDIDIKEKQEKISTIIPPGTHEDLNHLLGEYFAMNMNEAQLNTLLKSKKYISDVITRHTNSSADTIATAVCIISDIEANITNKNCHVGTDLCIASFRQAPSSLLLKLKKKETDLGLNNCPSSRQGRGSSYRPRHRQSYIGTRNIRL